MAGFGAKMVGLGAKAGGGKAPAPKWVKRTATGVTVGSSVLAALLLQGLISLQGSLDSARAFEKAQELQATIACWGEAEAKLGPSSPEGLAWIRGQRPAEGPAREAGLALSRAIGFEKAACALGQPASQIRDALAAGSLAALAKADAQLPAARRMGEADRVRFGALVAQTRASAQASFERAARAEAFRKGALAKACSGALGLARCAPMAAAAAGEGSRLEAMRDPAGALSRFAAAASSAAAADRSLWAAEHPAEAMAAEEALRAKYTGREFKASDLDLAPEREAFEKRRQEEAATIGAKFDYEAEARAVGLSL